METRDRILEQAQYLTFHIGEEEYGVGLSQVREILQYEAVTRVPTAPPWIRGVMNLRGSVVAVVDLGVKFGIGESAVTGTTCIVVVEVELSGERTVMGVLADSVSEVIDLEVSDIDAPPAFATRVRVEHLLGMGKVGKSLILLLDIDRILSSDELIALASTAVDDGGQRTQESSRASGHGLS